jgi:hypothetical protein
MARIEIECLRDCRAWCCTSRTLAFVFTEAEARFMVKSGADLTFVEGRGYFMNSDCPYLKRNKCSLHNTKMQPKCCAVNLAGGKVCLEILERVAANGYGVKLGYGNKE